MSIVNLFDAVTEGTFEDFINRFNGDINQVNEFTKLNLLHTAVLNDLNQREKIRIIDFMIANGVNINFVDKKYKRNALHTLYFNVMRGEQDYLIAITKKLIENGIDINAVDKFGAIPLKYAITILKGTTEELKNLYVYLARQGSDYNRKDSFGKTCLDYAEEYSWRNGFVNIIKELSNDR